MLQHIENAVAPGFAAKRACDRMRAARPPP
jgi:hypothetical protein